MRNPPVTSAHQEELFPVENPIRPATLLIRNPIHQLSTTECIPISIHQKTSSGRDTFWSISYNEQYGPPRKLAYQLETWVINRRIDQHPKPLPEDIKIASSLRELCRELGRSEKDTEHVKRALYQLAGTFIVAKFYYDVGRGEDRREYSFEFGDNRYGVFFLGQDLPSGRRSDGIYLSLHRVYREHLNRLPTRPLDYDYLRSLPHTAQRLYELLSPQIFGTLHHGRPYVRYRYSEFCTFAPLTRAPNWNQARAQLHSIHAPLLKTRYLESVAHTSCIDSEGHIDWELVYTPGKRAYDQYSAFTGEKKRPPRLPRPSSKPAEIAKPATTIGTLPLDPPEPEEALLRELLAAGLNQDTAERLTQESPEECRRQLALTDGMTDEDFEKSKAAWLVRAIPGRYGPPTKQLQRKKQEADQKQRETADTSRKAQEAAQNDRRAAIFAQGMELVGRVQQEASDVFTTFLEDEARSRAAYVAKWKLDGEELSRTKKALRDDYESSEQRVIRFVEHFSNHKCPIPELAEWVQEHPVPMLKTLLQ